MQLEFKNNGRVENVNVRKELHGDEGVVACDLKIAMDVEKTALACIDLDGQHIADTFWDSDGFPRFPLIEKMPTTIKEENHTIQLGKISLSPVTVKKLIITPKSNNVAALVFTVSTEPAKGMVEKLARLLEADVIDCHLQPNQEGLDLSNTETGDAA